MNTQNQSVQNSGHTTQAKNITFFMVMSRVGNVTNSIGPYFETKKQADDYLETIADRHENAFVVLYTSLTRNLENVPGCQPLSLEGACNECQY